MESNPPATPPQHHPPAAIRRRARWTLPAGLILGLLLVVAFWFMRSRPALEQPGVPLSELVLVEGRLVRLGTVEEPFSGWMIEHYPDGSIKSRSQVVAGVLEGLSEGWHPNGQLQIREQFVGGIAEGIVTKWHPNGVMLSEGRAVEGRFEGTFRRWHENGVPAEEVTMLRGDPEGLSRAWFPSGHLKAEVRIESGAIVHQQFWKDGEHPELALASGQIRKP